MPIYQQQPPSTHSPMPFSEALNPTPWANPASGKSKTLKEMAWQSSRTETQRQQQAPALQGHSQIAAGQPGQPVLQRQPNGGSTPGVIQCGLLDSFLGKANPRRYLPIKLWGYTEEQMQELGLGGNANAQDDDVQDLQAAQPSTSGTKKKKATPKPKKAKNKGNSKKAKKQPVFELADSYSDSSSSDDDFVLQDGAQVSAFDADGAIDAIGQANTNGWHEYRRVRAVYVPYTRQLTEYNFDRRKTHAPINIGAGTEEYVGTPTNQQVYNNLQNYFPAGAYHEYYINGDPTTNVRRIENDPATNNFWAGEGITHAPLQYIRYWDDGAKHWKQWNQGTHAATNLAGHRGAKPVLGLSQPEAQLAINGYDYWSLEGSGFSRTVHKEPGRTTKP